MTRYLQVDLLIVMGMGDSKGLGDPSMEGVLLNLAYPRHDSHGTSCKRAGSFWLRHLQGISNHTDGSL